MWVGQEWEEEQGWGRSSDEGGNRDEGENRDGDGRRKQEWVWEQGWWWELELGRVRMGGGKEQGQGWVNIKNLFPLLPCLG